MLFSDICFATYTHTHTYRHFHTPWTFAVLTMLLFSFKVLHTWWLATKVWPPLTSLPVVLCYAIIPYLLTPTLTTPHIPPPTSSSSGAGGSCLSRHWTKVSFCFCEWDLLILAQSQSFSLKKSFNLNVMDDLGACSGTIKRKLNNKYGREEYFLVWF